MTTYNDDCLKVMPTLPSKSIDLILTDPPYMISRDTNFSKGGGNEAKYGSLSMDFGEWDKGEAILPNDVRSGSSDDACVDYSIRRKQLSVLGILGSGTR